MEAKQLETADNLTVIVVCFVSELSALQQEQQVRRRSCKSLSMEVLCNLRSWLDC
jgi:protein phosphatase 2C family protein 2/3